MQNEVTLRVEGASTRGKRGESDDAETDLSSAPLFADLDVEGVVLDHVIVERLGPVREGNLGRFETDVTEELIFERCGGGRYRVQGRTAQHRPIKGAFKTVEIAGDPILQSELSRRQYKRQLGAAGSGDTPASAPGGSIQEIVAMLEATRQTAETERERRADEEEKRHKRELERLALEAKTRADERIAEDDRRRRLDEERDTKRRADDEERRRRDKLESDEREERRRRDDESARDRDRQFQQTLLAASKTTAPAVDPVAMLLAGVNLAGKLGGGGGPAEPADPLTALAANLPATVQELGRMFGANKGAPAGAAGGAADPLVIAGPLGEKGKRAVQHLQSQGFSAEQALEHVFDTFMGARKQTAPPDPAPAPKPLAPAATGTPPPPRRAQTVRPPAPAPRAAPAPAAAAAAAEAEPVDDAHPGGTAIP